MARVVCQVLIRPDRLTFVWSEGTASFEPYHKTGTNLQEFCAAARQVETLLRRLAIAPAGELGAAGAALAHAGHELYRQLFHADGAGTDVAQEVRGWLAGLEREGGLERLEMIGDTEETFPWDAVHDSPPDEDSFRAGADTPEAWRGFWGARLDLVASRRVSPLRSRPVFEGPVALLLIDPTAREALSAEGRERLRSFAQANGLTVLDSAAALADAIKAGRPDVLYVFCRVSGHSLLLGGDHVFAGELRDLLRAEGRGPAARSDTFIFLNACQGPGGEPDAHVLDLVGGLGTRASLAPRAPLPAEAANRFGVEFLTAFLAGGESLGRVLQRVRGGEAAFGLLYAAHAPAELRIVQSPAEEGEGEAEGKGEGASPAVGAEGRGAPSAEGSTMEEDEARLALPETPYFPLAPYDAADRVLFLGREDDTEAFAEALDEPGVRVVVLHGHSGAGKGSLLRAGVVPFLEEESVGYRILRDRGGEDEEPELEAGKGGEATPSPAGSGGEGDGRVPSEDDFPVVVVRATNDLAGQLAVALCDYCAHPYTYTTPTGRAVAVDLPGILSAAVGVGRSEEGGGGSEEERKDTRLSALPPPHSPLLTPPSPAGTHPQTEVEAVQVALGRDPGLLGRLLATLAEPLPHELVLLVEQGEEVFTLGDDRGGPSATPRTTGPRGLALLRRLADTPGRARVVLSLRTEYQGQLLGHLQQGPEDLTWLRPYLLEPLGEKALLDAVLAPTSIEPLAGAAEAPFTRYRFLYADGLAEQLVSKARQAAAAKRQSAAALLQVVCARLAARVQGRPDNVVRLDDVTRIGGVEDGLVLDFKERLRTLPLSGRDRALLRTLLDQLVLRAPDGTPARGLVPESQLAEDWKGARPLAVVLEAAADARLVELSWLDAGGQPGRHVSLGHDVLASVVEREAAESTRRAYGRTRMVDTLWVMIPLVILAAAWGLNRTLAVWNRDAALKLAETKEKELEREWRAIAAEAKAARWPTYAGFISRARESLAAGDLLAARQALLGQAPRRRKAEGETAFEPGFEWHYLWRQLDGSRQTLLSHLAPVTAVAIAPDGKALASAGADGGVKLWSADSGLIRADLVGHAGAVHTLAFAPKDGLLASAGADGVVRLWDATAGAKGNFLPKVEARQLLKGHKDAVLALAFAPDGKTLASAGKDGTVRLWDVAVKGKATERRALAEHKKAVNALAYTPDGETLASGDEDGGVKFWDVAARGKEKLGGALKENFGPVRALAYSSDGKLLASATERERDGFAFAEVRVWKEAPPWKAASGEPVKANLTGVFALTFTGDKTLVIAGKDGAVRLWDAALSKKSGGVALLKPGRRLAGTWAGWRAVAASADGKTLVTGSEDGTVKLWDTAGPETRDVLQGHKDWVNAVTFSPDDKNLASGGADGQVLVWDVVTGKERATLTPKVPLKGPAGAVLVVAYSPDGKLLASGDADGTVRLWDMAPRGKAKFGAELGNFKIPKGPVYTLLFAETNVFLFTGGADGPVRVWGVDPESKPDFCKEVAQFRGHKAPVRALALLPSPELRTTFLASAGDEGEILIRDLKTRALVGGLPLKGHTARIRALAHWPGTGTLLASAGDDRTVQLWGTAEVKQGQKLRWVNAGTMRGHSDTVGSLAFAKVAPPLLVSGGWDGVVRLWNPHPDILATRFTLTGHDGPVQAVAISSDQRTLAAAGRDGRVRLWRAAPLPAGGAPKEAHPEE